MKRVLAFVAFTAVGFLAASAQASDVCGYRVVTATGLLCPAASGSSFCVQSTSSIGGGCDQQLRCIGGGNFFCNLTMAPVSGPQPQCPFGSRPLPRGIRCATIVNFARNTATPTEVVEFTPSPSPTSTEEPTGTPTGTAAATVTETPEATQTGTPTGTAAATVTTGTGTSAFSRVFVFGKLRNR